MFNVESKYNFLKFEKWFLNLDDEFISRQSGTVKMSRVRNKLYKWSEITTLADKDTQQSYLTFLAITKNLITEFTYKVIPLSSEQRKLTV